MPSQEDGYRGHEAEKSPRRNPMTRRGQSMELTSLQRFADVQQPPDSRHRERASDQHQQ